MLKKITPIFKFRIRLLFIHCKMVSHYGITQFLGKSSGIKK
ncbi:hypothetical protein RINTU1_08800 [Candidatus Regiella insecticola]|uniref:Uncharacterized protein n=1 Tax=Candidatus Regiella insecticola TaxID=138073 RepID=A0A6L2ZLB1_9ENTR|nr:hypothetical protein RINTU1_08800 [Candidatus Regiella insecticola]